VVNASIDYLGELPKGASLSYKITDAKDSKSTLASGQLKGITTSGSTITGSILLGAQAPRLWWPSGMGEQNLYNITIQILDSNNKTLATVTRRKGFRTILLNSTNITETQLQQGIAPGANWHFEVNGHEFYAKGSNFIPPDAFWPRVTEARLNKLFDAVVAGNQNMLRVWASGAYSPDIMYDIADEKGVLLWSEFEFSDDMYPVDQQFLENVAAEVIYNVRRVNHHPSLALWAGGNEIESLELMLANNSDPAHYQKYVAQYEKLFISLMLPLVYENSHISYNPSSTTNGYYYVDLSAPVPMVERYFNVSPGHYYGDTDFYNYDSSISFDNSAYPVGRFANEFGYHSMPSLQTWEQVVPKKDLHFNSSVIQLRNHHYPSGDLSTDNFANSTKGMGEMTIAVERYYPIPHKTDSIANFSAWCHATQIFQADMYKSEIQFYRRGSGFPNRQLGSLYWQLEDIWQAPTWAGIEYDGRWKVLHYMAKDIYQPVIISPFWNYTTGDLEVYVTSDLWESVSGTAKLNWYSYDGKLIPHNAGTPQSASFYVGAINTTQIYSANIKELSIPDLKDAVLVLSIEGSGHRPNEPAGTSATKFTHENFFSPVWMNAAKLVDPGLEVAYNSKTQKFTVEATKAVALYTWLDYPAGLVGYFDENNFVLVPGQKKEIGFTVQDAPSSPAWAKEVSVQSMWDQTQKT
jgi:beta-mannosidase